MGTSCVPFLGKRPHLTPHPAPPGQGVGARAVFYRLERKTERKGLLAKAPSEHVEKAGSGVKSQARADWTQNLAPLTCH